MKMKALLLCGGFATRLEPITYFIPKPLLPIGVGGKPIVEYILDDMIDAGIENVVISTNAKFANNFRYWVKSRAYDLRVSAKIVVEKTLKENEKFGAVKGIWYAIEKAKIDTDLLIVLGDNLYDFSLKDAISYFKQIKTPIVVVYDIGSKENAKRFGVVELSGSVISSFTEKPAEPKSTLISTGIYIFPKESLKTFQEYLKESNNPDAPGYFVEWLVKKTEVHAYAYKGKWYDIGTLETYKRVFDEYNTKQFRNG